MKRSVLILFLLCSCAWQAEAASITVNSASTPASINEGDTFNWVLDVTLNDPDSQGTYFTSVYRFNSSAPVYTRGTRTIPSYPHYIWAYDHVGGSEWRVRYLGPESNAYGARVRWTQFAFNMTTTVYDDTGGATLSQTLATTLYEGTYNGGYAWYQNPSRLVFPALTGPVVQNVAPTIQSTTVGAAQVRGLDAWSFSAYATDPGIYDTITYEWDLDGDGLYDDHVGASGTTSFSRMGIQQIGLRVSDGDGGVSTQLYNVEVVPEPSSLAFLLCGGLLLGGLRRP